jgi:hypothetical protein
MHCGVPNAYRKRNVSCRYTTISASLYDRWKDQYRSFGIGGTIPGIWLLQVVDTAEGMINVTFIDSFNHRKAARDVYNRYAEHFSLQTWSHDGDNDLYRYCIYIGNIHVLILKEIIF